ncbi:MAG: GAF domain-containing sensor histidine kinase [Dehalococcoidales bacterium]|nr:GAF domain-containing sensor histidine kinase [Dehalococcoidales bacterium]
MGFNIFFYRKGDSLSLKIIKIITVAAPAIFIALFEAIRHTVFIEHDPMLGGNLVLVAVVTLSAFFFSRLIFGKIERMQRESLRRNQELAAINNVALAVSESLNLDVVLYQALDKLLEVTAADAGELFLLDKQANEMVRQAHSGLLPDAFHGKIRFKIDEGFTEIMKRSGAKVAVRELAQDQELFAVTGNSGGFRSLAAVPLLYKTAVIGAINIYSLEAEHFTADDTQLLANIGNQIAVAIENARLHERMQDMAALEERERIAREMHDGLAQVLSYVLAKSQAAKQFISSGQGEQAEEQLEELENIAQEVYADVRETILGLRTATPPRRDMITTLQEYIIHFNQMSGIKTEVDSDSGGYPRLPANVELQVIRIIQEALTNVRKHSGASYARVRISGDETKASITIEDNGRGFNISHIPHGQRPQFGLKIMQERAKSIGGTLVIKATPDKGTRVSLEIPLDQKEKRKLESTAR